MKTRMTMIAAALSAAMAAQPVLASDDEGYEDGMSMESRDEIRMMLEEDGWDVRKMEAEDGMIEAYAVRDGKAWELYLDESGEIVRRKEQ